MCFSLVYVCQSEIHRLELRIAECERSAAAEEALAAQEDATVQRLQEEERRYQQQANDLFSKAQSERARGDVHCAQYYEERAKDQQRVAARAADDRSRFRGEHRARARELRADLANHQQQRTVQQVRLSASQLSVQHKQSELQSHTGALRQHEQRRDELSAQRRDHEANLRTTETTLSAQNLSHSQLEARIERANNQIQLSENEVKNMDQQV